MQTFRSYNEDLRHLSLLFLPFTHLSVSVADSDLPLHSQSLDYFYHGSSNILCQCPKRSYPYQTKMISGFDQIGFRMFIYKIDYSTKKNRKSLAATCWGIYET